MAKEKDQKNNPETLEVNESIQDLTPTENAPVEKKVKVRGLQNHSCTIGHERIIVEKNKETTFTASIATILQNAGIIAILA